MKRRTMCRAWAGHIGTGQDRDTSFGEWSDGSEGIALELFLPRDALTQRLARLRGEVGTEVRIVGDARAFDRVIHRESHHDEHARFFDEPGELGCDWLIDILMRQAIDP